LEERVAVRHRLIQASPQDVWAVLADSERYVEWVVGPCESTPDRGNWPEVDSTLHYEVPLGPLKLANETVVRRCEEGSVLELEAKAGPLGTARIAIELRPWGRDTLVLVDEHPLRGPGGLVHNTAVDVLIHLRHRAMLARLAKLCESESGAGEPTGTRTAPARPGASRA
jgi:uncharacterized protein YndB with AHSA1/START domain